MNQEERFNNKQIWTLRIHEYQTSGMTQQQWCDKEGISCSTLRYWLRKLRQEMSQELTADWLQVCVSEDSTVPILSSSEKISRQTGSTSGNIVIHVRDISIDVPLDTPLEYVSCLLQVVGHA